MSIAAPLPISSIAAPRADPDAPPDLASMWIAARENLCRAVGRDTFDTWLHTLQLDVVEAGSARLSVPTRFLRSWIERHYLGAILAALRDAGAAAERVAIAVRTSVIRPAPSPCTPVPARSGIAPAVETADPPPSGPGSPLDPRMTFASFVVGDANRLAHAAVTAGLAAFRPLVIHGETGLGKTHLLQAAAHAAGAAARYVTAEQLRFSFSAALRVGGAAAWRASLAEASVLLLDDLHIDASKALTAEIVHLLDLRGAIDRPTVVAIDRPVADLGGDERLQSRLAGGLDVGLSRPDEPLRRAIVVMKLAALAEQHAGFCLPSDVIDLVAAAIAKSPRDLEGALARLLMRHTLDGTPPTREAAEREIGDLVGEGRRPAPRIEIIQRVVARRYGVGRGDLLSARRTAGIVRPRQIAMYLAKTMTLRSLPEIGRRFGGRDHTTVMHAVRKFERLRGDCSDIAGELDALALEIALEG